VARKPATPPPESSSENDAPVKKEEDEAEKKDEEVEGEDEAEISPSRKETPKKKDPVPKSPKAAAAGASAATSPGKKPKPETSASRGRRSSSSHRSPRKHDQDDSDDKMSDIASGLDFNKVSDDEMNKLSHAIQEGRHAAGGGKLTPQKTQHFIKALVAAGGSQIFAKVLATPAAAAAASSSTSNSSDKHTSSRSRRRIPSFPLLINPEHSSDDELPDAVSVREEHATSKVHEIGEEDAPVPEVKNEHPASKGKTEDFKRRQATVPTNSSGQPIPSSTLMKTASQRGRTVTRATPFKDRTKEKRRCQLRYPKGRFGWKTWYYWPSGYQLLMGQVILGEYQDDVYREWKTLTRSTLKKDEKDILAENQQYFDQLRGRAGQWETAHMPHWRRDHHPPFSEADPQYLAESDEDEGAKGKPPKRKHSASHSADLEDALRAELLDTTEDLSDSKFTSLVKLANTELENLEPDFKKHGTAMQEAAFRAVSKWRKKNGTASSSRLSPSEEAIRAKALGLAAATQARGSTPYATSLLSRMEKDSSNISRAAAAGYMKNVDTKGPTFVAVNKSIQRALHSQPVDDIEASEGDEDDDGEGSEAGSGEDLDYVSDEGEEEDNEDINDEASASSDDESRSGYHRDPSFVASNKITPKVYSKPSGNALSHGRGENEQKWYETLGDFEDQSEEDEEEADSTRKKKKPRTTASAGRSSSSSSSKGAGKGPSRSVGARMLHFEALRGNEVPSSDSDSPAPAASRTIHIRMARFDGASAPARDRHLTLHPYRHGAGLSAVQWVTRFLAYCKLTKVPLEDMPELFTWYQADATGRQACQSVRRREGETARSWFARMLGNFSQTFGQTDLERRSLQTALMSLRKLPDEHIDDFLARWFAAWALLHEGTSEEEFGSGDFTLLLHALGPAIQAHAATWIWVGPLAGRVKNHDGGIIIRNRAHLTALLRMYTQSRTRTEKLDTLEQELQEYEARKNSVHNSLGSSLLELDSTYRGTHSHSRLHEIGSARMALVNPDLREETKAKWNEYKRKIRTNGGSSLMDEKPETRKKDKRHSKKKRKRQGPTREPTPERAPSPPPQPKKQRQERSLRAMTGDNDTNRKFGPCPNCAMPHDWEFCPRNKNGKRFQERALPFLDKGPHPLAKPADCKAVGLPAPKSRSAMKTRSTKTADSSSDSSSSSSSGSGSSSGSSDSDSAEKPTRLLRRIVIGPSGEREIHIAGAINGLTLTNMIVDTGSHGTIIDSSFFKTHRARFGHLGKKPGYSVKLADGQRAKVKGTVKLNLMLKGELSGETRSIRHTFVVVDNLSVPIIIGLDVCDRMFNSLNFQTGLLEFRDKLTRVRAVRIVQEEGQYNPLICMEGIVIPARSGRVVQVYFDKRGYDKNATVICEADVLHDRDGNELAITFPPHIQMAHLPNDRYQLLVHNPSDSTLTLRAGIPIGTVAQFNQEKEMTDAPQGQYRVRYDGELEPVVPMTIGIGAAHLRGGLSPEDDYESCSDPGSL
jgi:hypothetical protein